LIASDLLRALLAPGFLTIATEENIWLTYVFTATLMAASTFFGPAKTAVIPSIVSNSDLFTANALFTATMGFVLVIGSVLGGTIAASVGPNIAFILNSASFAISALLILSIDIPWERAKGKLVQRPAFLVDLEDGMTHILRTPLLLSAMLVSVGWGFGGGALNVLISVFGSQIFRAGSMGIGILYASLGAGVMLGTWSAKYLVGDDLVRMKWAVGFGSLFDGVLFIIFSRTSNIYVGAPLMIGVSTAEGFASTSWITILIRLAPDKLRGENLLYL
jgi:predicted MFS family arabinose efflux permease